MKENSHRAPHWCYRSGDWTFLCTHARRLDGYRVYSAGDLRCPRASAAGRRPIRPALRELGWRGGAAQGAGRPPGGHRAVGGQSDRRPAARQGPARGDRAGAAARLRDRLRLRRLQRRRAPGPGPGAQAPARARSPRGAGFGVPGDALPVRERGGRQELYLASLGLATWSSSTIARGSGAGPGASRSTSIRPTIPPTGSRSSPSSMATTTRGVTCRWWRR